MLLGERGFSLVEVLVAVTILLIGLAGLLSLLDAANGATTTVRAREGATTLARQVTEAARSIPYSALTPQSIVSRLQAQPGLERNVGGLDWTVDRRGFRYSITATVCSVDDPADGLGQHGGGAFCDVGGTVDRNPDDYKRVRVEVSWRERSVVRKVQQVALVNNPGSAGGPAVTGLSLTSPANPLITTAVSMASLQATTSSPASGMRWSVDGVVEATAAGSATAWVFAWPIAQLVDGTYLVTAQAFDHAGLSGPTQSVTITLNRSAPAAPAGVAAGRNGAVVELEWLLTAERDIVGYRVVRAGVGGGTEVCALTRSTSCQDATPPSGTPTYHVVAVDLDPAGAQRDGALSEPVTVTSAAEPPAPPTELTATHADGVTTLRWAAPAAGDGIAFYRVYRDGTQFSDRYDRTGIAAELTYSDGDTGGASHSYWVVAVNEQLAESAPVGPVTL